MTQVLVLQHIGCETLGTIEGVLETQKIGVTYIRSYAGDPIPQDLEGYAGLIVLGGPMGVYQHHEFPFLSDEMRLIEHALQHETPILGICLGSQLLASALGAEVHPGERQEIGWRSLSLTDAAREDPLWRDTPSSFVGFHWHGDVFSLPRQAVALAYSDQTAYQAFRYGKNAYGFLFHMEVTEPILRDLVETFPEDLSAAGIRGAQVIGEIDALLPPLKQIGDQVFLRWSRLLTERQ